MVFAFEQYDRFPFTQNSVVYLFPFLDANVGAQLRSDFSRIKNVISQSAYERHEQRVFCGFLCLYVLQLFRDTCRQLPNLDNSRILSMKSMLFSSLGCED
jgi:hypothetical protein